VVGYSFSQGLNEAKLLVDGEPKLFDAEGDRSDLTPAYLCGFKEARNLLNFL
jgi:hypothetical protein